MALKNKKLRSGYTTGACAAAAAKAATVLLMRSAECGDLHPVLTSANARVQGVRSEEEIQEVSIPFPDGSRVQFAVRNSSLRTHNSELISSASVIKDAGDDPDVTHGAEIIATVRFVESGLKNEECPQIVIKGGKGVGRVTKPGLAIPVGEPAINPVPRKMIREAVMEAITESVNQPIPLPTSPLKGEELNKFPPLQGEGKGGDGLAATPHLEVTISVPAGEELAKKTLNHRLGIVGGISILGTTGIVRPVSREAYTATITAGMDVAKAMGHSVVVLSSGRTSEKAHMKKFAFPDESYVMMGDYLEFSLIDAKNHGFSSIHLCAQWAKMIKTAMSTPQTHVRHGAIEATNAAAFLRFLGVDVPPAKEFNTAREIFDYINAASSKPLAPSVDECLRECRVHTALAAVCAAAKQYAERITSGIPVIVHLVSYEGKIIAASE